ncbi:hypothetical protein [Actinokineospora iranica]|uniref:Uncharacterized protein n=1 Tax=Actinokineospora iranica TaxID=1271860 RepID=A0A1G6XHK8_9PSEU|nr:hypothetical protein [Actinokineospora iranica]SDD76797.1 hypothetical protein SAMN05216174_11776 [Actinokineospora iranica]
MSLALSPNLALNWASSPFSMAVTVIATVPDFLPDLCATTARSPTLSFVPGGVVWALAAGASLAGASSPAVVLAAVVVSAVLVAAAPVEVGGCAVSPSPQAETASVAAPRTARSAIRVRLIVFCLSCGC